MNIVESQKNPNLSDDLIVVLLRGNGSPRTFRFSLPALQRSLTTLGFLFAFAVAAAIFLLLLNLFHFGSDRAETSTTSPTPAAALTSAPSDTGKNDLELHKEVAGLHEDIARLTAQADGRKELANGANSGLLQFFGPSNTSVAESLIQVKNLKVVRGPTKSIYVDFELHNVDPNQKQARGYIVVLAKTPSFLAVYPEGVFSSNQNIVLDFTKGETFAVSRFRQGRAIFPSASLNGKDAQFQVLLFGTDGKVIADLHVEDSHQ